MNWNERKFALAKWSIGTNINKLVRSKIYGQFEISMCKYFEEIISSKQFLYIRYARVVVIQAFSTYPRTGDECNTASTNIRETSVTQLITHCLFRCFRHIGIVNEGRVRLGSTGTKLTARSQVYTNNSPLQK